jgi:hypothetical protein
MSGEVASHNAGRLIRTDKAARQVWPQWGAA